MKAYGENVLCKKIESNDLVSTTNIHEYEVINTGSWFGQCQPEDQKIKTIFAEKSLKYKEYYIIKEDDILAYTD